jgi:hypothetical protein
MTTKPMITNKLLFIIEWMTENTLLQIILDFTSEQIARPWQILQNDNQFDPLCGLLDIKKWGTL